MIPTTVLRRVISTDSPCSSHSSTVEVACFNSRRLVVLIVIHWCDTAAEWSRGKASRLSQSGIRKADVGIEPARRADDLAVFINDQTAIGLFREGEF